MANQLINIEVAYATPERQKIILSGISDIFPDLDLDTADFGIWGKAKPATTTVEDSQRIEIYRPLLTTPPCP